MASGRGPRAALHAASWSTAPSAIASRIDAGVVAAGHVREVGRGDHALPAGRAGRRRAGARRPASSSLITSSRSISGGVPRDSRQRLALGEQQREQPEPLLAPRAVGAQLAPVAAQDEVVAVRPVAGEAALEVGRRARSASSAASSSAVAARERGR